MRRTLKVLEGVRDGRGRLGRLLLVGGSVLLEVFFLCRGCCRWWRSTAAWSNRGGGGGLFQALTTRSPAFILPVQVLVMSLPFVELLDIKQAFCDC